MKVNQKQKENFVFLVKTWKKDTVEPLEEKEPVRGGRSALVCFCAHDSTGKQLPCADPVTLRKAKESKAFWNLQIKSWAQSMAEGTLMEWEVMDYTRECPSWIRKATINQARKMNPRAGKYTMFPESEFSGMLGKFRRKLAI